MPPAIPLATYRLQLTKDFTFDDAAALVPYLKQLGVSHLYASPFLKARPGSTHGYDIIDHGQLNPELGGEEGFARLSDALRAHDLGLILDFVPNHMGVGHSDNAWWLDVLEWGKESPYAQAFDIDWDAVPFRHNPGVLLPILGKPYGEVRPLSRPAVDKPPDNRRPGPQSAADEHPRRGTAGRMTGAWRGMVPRGSNRTAGNALNELTIFLVPDFLLTLLLTFRWRSHEAL